MAVNLSALAGAGQQFFDNNGNPLSGGKLWSYQAGTTTPQTTYTTASGNVAHTNPIILDSAGRVATGQIWLTAGSNYKFTLMTSVNATLATWDNITGINGTGITSNASTVVYDPAGTGAVPTTVQAKLRESVSVLDFGAVGDGVTDDTTAIQAAISAAAGKTLLFPKGTYKTTGTLTLVNHSTYIGDSSGSTVISYSGTSDAVRIANPINASTGAFIQFSNIGIACTNGASVGACFADVGSTYLTVSDCFFTGGKYGMILDQTEISTFSNNVFQLFTYGGVWIVNGAEHTTGGLFNYSNVLAFNSCQFNGAITSAVTGVIDDGGSSHNFHNCNFNGLYFAFALAGVLNINIIGCQSEACGGSIIRCFGTTFTGSVAVGPTLELNISGCYFAVGVGIVLIDIYTLGSLTYTGNRSSSSGGVIIGAANANSIFAYGNQDSGIGNLISGKATHHFESAVANPTLAIKTTILELTGDYTVSGTSAVTGIATANNCIRFSGNGLTPLTTGISVNFTGNGGRALLAIISGQGGTGNDTCAATYMLRFGYSGNNITAAKISGDDGGLAAGASNYSFTQTSGILFVAPATVAQNYNIQFMSS